MSTAQLLPEVLTFSPWIPGSHFLPREVKWVHSAHEEQCSQGENWHRGLEGTEYH